MTESYTVIAVCAAITAFFAWHIVSAWRDCADAARREREIERTRRELNNAIENGYVGAIAMLRQRLRELLGE